MVPSVFNIRFRIYDCKNLYTCTDIRNHHFNLKIFFVNHSVYLINNIILLTYLKDLSIVQVVGGKHNAI